MAERPKECGSIGFPKTPNAVPHPSIHAVLARWVAIWWRVAMSFGFRRMLIPLFRSMSDLLLTRFETGQRSARLLLRLLRKEIRPVTARIAIPVLVRGDELITASGVFGQIVGQARHIEQSSGGLSAGMFIGNLSLCVNNDCIYNSCRYNRIHGNSCQAARLHKLEIAAVGSRRDAPLRRLSQRRRP